MREEVMNLEIEELSEEEIKEVNKIFKRFVKKYEENPDREITDWMAEQLHEELPDRSDEEIQSIAEEIKESVESYEEDLRDLNQSCKYGLSKEQWLSDKLQSSAKGMAVNQFGNYLSKIDETLNMANSQMERTILNMNGEVSQSLNLDGFIAEQYHVNDFNAKAALENSPFRARVCVPENEAYGKNSVDVMIDNIKTKEKGILRYQFKFGKDYSSTKQMLDRGDYHNQRIVVPKGQSEILKEEYPTKSITDYIGGVDKIKTKSTPATKEEMKEFQRQAQEEGVAVKTDWNGYTTKELSVNIGKQAGSAGVHAAIFSAGVGIVSKAMKGEEIEADEVVTTALTTGADAGVKAAAGGALKVASEKGVLKILPPGTPAGTIAKMACVGIENVKILWKVAKGEITMSEALEQMGRTSVSMYAGLSASAIGAGVGATVLGFIPIVGPIVGGVVGGIVGYMAGSTVGEKVFDGAKKVYHKAKEAVTAGVEKLKDVGRGIKNWLFG